jgi:hypothetical protein
MSWWQRDELRRLARTAALVDIAVALVVLTKAALSPSLGLIVVGAVLLVGFAPLARLGRGRPL